MSKADPAREQTIQFKSIKSPPLEGNQFNLLWFLDSHWPANQIPSQLRVLLNWTKDIRAVLEKGLKDNYSEVSVSIVECPDLTEEPFGLAAKGTYFIGHLSKLPVFLRYLWINTIGRCRWCTIFGTRSCCMERTNLQFQSCCETNRCSRCSCSWRLCRIKTLCSSQFW